VAPGRPRGSRSRRVSLPGVAELLRPAGRGTAVGVQREASGRELHTQKITVYLSGSELLDLERARLTLRALGITVDRGRIVREALAVLLADLDAEGDRSLVARRLCEGASGGAWGGRPPGPTQSGGLWGHRGLGSPQGAECPPEGAQPE
jgi:hypothetical protein